MKLFITHISCHTLCDRPTWLSIIEMGLLLLDMYVVYQSKTLPRGNSFLMIGRFNSIIVTLNMKSSTSSNVVNNDKCVEHNL